MSERRIEVHTRYATEPFVPLDEEDILDWVEVDGLCNKCEDDHEVRFADDFALPSGEGVTAFGWGGIFQQAEVQGLDLTRQFKMEMHLAQEYIEFWQTPGVLP